jgi:WD40 repeat protein
LPILRLQHDRDVLAIAWGPDSSLLATASADNTARLWDAKTGREAARMEHGEAVNGVAFHRNGYIVATASADHTVSIWSDEQVGQAVYTLYYEPGFKDLDFNADETLLATATLDQQVLVWNVAEERVVLAIAVGTEIIDVDYSRDGTLIATAGEDGRACIWDAVSGEQVVCFQHQGAVQDADWSRDGSFLITSAHDGTVRFWDVRVQGEMRRFNQPGPANEASLHPDGTFLAVSTTVNAALIWDAATGELVFTLPHPAPVNLIGIRADQNWIITVAADNTLRIWDLATGALVDKFINDTNLLSLEVGPDGSTIATAAEDNIARIRDFATAEEIARIVHTDRINDVTFVADGEFLATASADGRVLISILEPEELIDKACSRLTRNLTVDEWNEFVHGLYEKTCPNLPPDPQAIANLLAEAGNAGTRGETDLGLALLEQAQSLDPSLTFDAETELVLLTQEAFINQGFEYLSDGQVRNALVKLNQIQARYPDLDTDPYRELLASLCQAVEVESAEDLLEACTAGIALETASPALRLLYIGRARQAAALGRLPEAVTDLETALTHLHREDFPDQESYDHALAQLQGYLQALEAGANPFED